MHKDWVRAFQFWYSHGSIEQYLGRRNYRVGHKAFVAGYSIGKTQDNICIFLGWLLGYSYIPNSLSQPRLEELVFTVTRILNQQHISGLTVMAKEARCMRIV